MKGEIQKIYNARLIQDAMTILEGMVVQLFVSFKWLMLQMNVDILYSTC